MNTLIDNLLSPLDSAMIILIATVSLCYLILGIDDLLIDLLALGRRLKPSH